MPLDSLSLILLILGMFAVTFSIRFILFARAHRIQLPVWLEEALAYVPVAVLTAIIMPMMLMTDEQLNISWHNPWLLGGLAAFIIGLILRHPLVTIAVGVLVFFSSQLLFA